MLKALQEIQAMQRPNGPARAGSKQGGGEIVLRSNLGRFRSCRFRTSFLGRYFIAPPISLLGGISLLRFRLRSWDDIFSLLRFRSWARFRSSDFGSGPISSFGLPIPLLRSEVGLIHPILFEYSLCHPDISAIRTEPAVPETSSRKEWGDLKRI